MTASAARFRHTGICRPVKRIRIGTFGQKLGSAALLCRWSRVLGQLNETAAAGGRQGC